MKNTKNNNSIDEFPILMSVHDLQAMGMGRSMAYKLLGSDKLPTVHIGDRVFLLRDKFYEWLENGGDKTLSF